MNWAYFFIQLDYITRHTLILDIQKTQQNNLKWQPNLA